MDDFHRIIVLKIEQPRSPEHYIKVSTRDCSSTEQQSSITHRITWMSLPEYPSETGLATAAAAAAWMMKHCLYMTVTPRADSRPASVTTEVTTVTYRLLHGILLAVL